MGVVATFRGIAPGILDQLLMLQHLYFFLSVHPSGGRLKSMDWVLEGVEQSGMKCSKTLLSWKCSVLIFCGRGKFKTTINHFKGEHSLLMPDKAYIVPWTMDIQVVI